MVHHNSLESEGAQKSPGNGYPGVHTQIYLSCSSFLDPEPFLSEWLRTWPLNDRWGTSLLTSVQIWTLQSPDTVVTGAGARKKKKLAVEESMHHVREQAMKVLLW